MQRNANFPKMWSVQKKKRSQGLSFLRVDRTTGRALLGGKPFGRGIASRLGKAVGQRLWQSAPPGRPERSMPATEAVPQPRPG